jgi:hypothetical protein
MDWNKISRYLSYQYRARFGLAVFAIAIAMVISAFKH